jgi:pyrroloquinoline quinone biosynthesis protein D
VSTAGIDFVPRLARRARLRFDRHEARTMILYPERGLLLNESAAAVAELCDGTRTVAEIVATIAIERGVARETIERDICRFIAMLRAKGLLE